MMDIVVLGSRPKGEEVMQTPREFVAAMRINGLEESEDDPQIHCQNVQIFGDSAVEDRRTNSAETENHNLDWRGIFSSHAERSRVLVVDLMNVLV